MAPQVGVMVIALPITSFSIGLGQNYAQANHWFDIKPNVRQYLAPTKANP
jgi:hypothetical protein